MCTTIAVMLIVFGLMVIIEDYSRFKREDDKNQAEIRKWQEWNEWHHRNTPPPLP